MHITLFSFTNIYSICSEFIHFTPHNINIVTEKFKVHNVLKYFFGECKNYDTYIISKVNQSCLQVSSRHVEAA